MEFDCGETIMTCPLRGGAPCDKNCAWAVHYSETDSECGTFASWECSIQVLASCMINNDEEECVSAW